MSDEQIAETESATEQTTMADLASSIPDKAEQTSTTSDVQASSDNVGDFQAFAEKINKLTEKVESTSQQTEALANSQQQDLLNKEIAEAVEKINESVGGDADMAELFLEKEVRTNPAFEKVWKNRHTNPEAYSKALDILTPEWAAKNTGTIDPSVAENQRALKESQKGGATVQVDSLHQELDKMESGEFMSYAQRLAQGG